MTEAVEQVTISPYPMQLQEVPSICKSHYKKTNQEFHVFKLSFEHSKSYKNRMDLCKLVEELALSDHLVEDKISFSPQRKTERHQFFKYSEIYIYIYKN
jgi:hypothetical protein